VIAIEKNIMVASHRRSGTHLTIDSLINNLVGAGPSFVTLETLLPQHKEHLTLEEFESKRTANTTPIIKTHTLPDMEELSGDEQARAYAIALRENSRVIYVLRDGRDVMVSFFEFRRRHTAAFRSVTFDTFLRQSYRNDLTPPACWAHHVNAWANTDNVLIVTYENYHNAFESTLSKLSKHVGLPVKNETIDMVISRNADAEKASSSVLFRRGLVGDYINYFSKEDLDFFESEAAAGIELFDVHNAS